MKSNKLFFILFFILLLSLIKDIKFNLGPNIYISEVIMFLLLILNIKKTIFSENRNNSIIKISNKFKKIYFILLYYYIFIMIFSIIDGADYKPVLGRFRNLYFALLTFFVGLHFFNSIYEMKKIFKMLNVFFVFAFVVGVINILSPIQFLTPDNFEEHRYTMIINQPIGSIVILISLLSLLKLFFKKGGVINIIMILLIFVAIVGSQNRSLILLLALSVLLTLMTLIKQKSINFRNILIIGVTGLSFFIISINLSRTTFSESYLDRYNTMSDEITGDRNFEDSQLMLRIGRSIATFENFLKNPIFGAGWEYKFYELKIYDFDGKYLKTAYGTPHNYFMNQLLQTGIVGLFFMLRIFYLVYKNIKPKVKISKNSITEYSLYFTFILLMVFNFFNVYLYGTPAYIGVTFFFLGLSVSHNILKNEKLNNG